MALTEINQKKKAFLESYISMAETDYRAGNLTFEECVNKLRAIAYNNNQRIGRPFIQKVLKTEIDSMKAKYKEWGVRYRD